MGNKTAIWILKKLILYGGVFVIFYAVGFGLGIIPQPLKDMVNWGVVNFQLLAFLFCFTLGAYIAVKFLNRRKV